MSVRKVVAADENGAAEECARHMLGILQAALAEQPHATLAVSGGSSPKLLFDKLAAARFAWDRVHLFWVDERCVPPADEASNYKMAKEHLIDPAGILAGNVHRILGEIPPEEAARRYVEEIGGFFGIPDGMSDGVSDNRLPQFDLLHRGMGGDAHTASLFPGSPLIDDLTGIAAPVFAAHLNSWRVTLLPGVLLAARHTVVEACGADKAPAVRHVFGPEYDPKKYPSQLGLRSPNEVVWFLDEAANGQE
jgi:6-phosphogluconolactonase